MLERLMKTFFPDTSKIRAGTGRVRRAGKMMSYYILIGIIAGAGSIAFHYLCQLGIHFFMDLMAGYRPPSPAGEGHLFSPTGTIFNRWTMLLLPAAGGIISGWLVYTFAPEAEGHGTDAAIDSYHNKGGFIRGRIPFIKTMASAVTLTTGGSGGREGPIAQIGAGFGSFLATKLGLSDRDRRIMLAAGLGAGVGSIFRAPLAGALFSAEVLYSDPEFEAEVIIPSGISSVVAYCLFCLVFGWGSLFHSKDFVFTNPLELGPYTVLAFVLAGAGIVYIKSFYGISDLFKKIRIPNHLKPALGGLCTGAVGFFLPQTLSFGYGYAQMALDNQLPTLLLIGIAFGKILTTSLSIGSGGSGGVFGPSVVIGGTLGGSIGRIFHRLMPGIVAEPGAFVVVGMAGFFAAVSNTPISTIIFVSEMTNSYHLLLPGLLVCSLSFLLCRKWTIYVKQVKGRIDSEAHRGDFFVDILAEIKVGELSSSLREVRLIPENMTFKQFREIFRTGEQHYFPLVDREKKLTGIFSVNDIRSVLFDQEIGDVVLMKDVANPDIIFTTPSEDLNEVLKKFTIKNLHQVPVVSDEDHRHLLGMLDRREVIERYNRRVMDMKSGLSRDGSRVEKSVARLDTVPVGDAMHRDVESIPAHMKLTDAMDFIYRRKYNSFPVHDERGRLRGMLSLSDCERAYRKGDLSLTVLDIATKDVIYATEQEKVSSALQKLSEGNFAALPVTEENDPTKVTGMVTRRDIMSTLSELLAGTYRRKKAG